MGEEYNIQVGTQPMSKTLSTFQIAKILRVNPGSVANWVDRDLVAAHRTPGGHRRVACEDLVTFLRGQKMPIPEELESGPTRILIVDDEPAITQLIARVISAAHPDFEITEAHDGFYAGTSVATRKPHVVILDLRMPGMDGYAVCRLIKAQESTKHTEVLAMTAYPSPENQQRILECGAKLCMSKPLDMEALLEEIAGCL